MEFRTIVLIAASLALLAAACSSGDASVESSQSIVVAGADPAAPDTVIARFDGSPATLSDYSGSPVVVNFWASWCPACVAELGAALQPAYETVGDDIAFLGVNIQDERKEALELVEEAGISFDLAVDPDGDLYLAFEAIGMPFTALVDADGRVVARHNGPLTETQLLTMIEDAFST